ncbi:alpha/beta fold hydrolase [Alteromonas aestuariivivens]|uniref:Alpha/beta fold hydrolase n=1 Tax=Alteromonas aestuariivivens TaxID=1938339 RepID=A0A3D8MBD4_9ALTE|nr:alpha/beta fold hydrolase [Alteromonas aestuariivivens]RDV27568.1 alpha/beta fold hydrolase [Alteromonas aestuariivivens]
MSDYLVTPAQNPLARLIFAHGAGAGMDSPFMQQMADLLGERGIEVVRFNFPYMQTIAETGKRRPPDRMPRLLEHFQQVISEMAQRQPLATFVGGKSMGGRAATLLVEQADVKGAVVMGYPFHPPGKPEKLRTEHLVSLSKPLLVLQGERDTFGRREEVQQYPLASSIETHFLADGDHSLKPRKASGFDYTQHLAEAADRAVHFMEQHR